MEFIKFPDFVIRLEGIYAYYVDKSSKDYHSLQILTRGGHEHVIHFMGEEIIDEFDREGIDIDDEILIKLNNAFVKALFKNIHNAFERGCGFDAKRFIKTMFEQSSQNAA